MPRFLERIAPTRSATPSSSASWATGATAFPSRNRRLRTSRSVFALAFLTTALIAGDDFGALKKAHPTKLRKADRAPEDYSKFVPPADTQVIQYKSGELNLRAWFRTPAAAAGKKVPAILYLHEGFALNRPDFDVTQTFLNAGFAVLIPTWRGENGNPGSYELFYGEADDACAAVKWLAEQPGIDAAHLYAFGHGSGGAISGLLSLYADLPLRFTGSCGGIFTEKLFQNLQQERPAFVPFDIKDEQEVRLRLLGKCTEQMQRKHFAIIGRKDTVMLRQGNEVQKLSEANKAPLQFLLVDGDHTESRQPAMQLFIETVRKDLERP